MSTALIAIITVTYNAASTFERAIKSIVNQNFEVDYIVIDGGSTDGTIEIAERYRDVIKLFVSEPDNGIYDAMNKGLNLATANWIYFLGADDILQPDVLKTIHRYLIEPYKVVFGDVIFDNNQRFHSTLSTRILMQNTLHHQSAFYHRSLFENFQYDHSLSIQADYELNIRVYIQHLPTKYVPITISTYALGGASAGHTEKSLKEINRIRARYVKSRWQNASLTVLLRLYYWQKQFRFWLYGHKI